MILFYDILYYDLAEIKNNTVLLYVKNILQNSKTKIILLSVKNV